MTSHCNRCHLTYAPLDVQDGICGGCADDLREADIAALAAAEHDAHARAQEEADAEMEADLEARFAVGEAFAAEQEAQS